MNAHAATDRAATGLTLRARPLLGTFVEIGATGPDPQTVAGAIESAFQAVAQVHALMSYHSADSDVSRINREAASRPVVVHASTWQVLAAAQEMAQVSDGLFDITVAPALTRLGLLPRHGDFPRASGTGRWPHVELLSGRRVRLARPLRIDLSGIAKGYAVDRAIEALRQAGMTAGCVNAGGDLRAFGDTAQTIRLRRIDAPSCTLPLVGLTEGACATSAAYFSARRYRGRLVSALIHPLTRASCGVGRSVSVLAPHCITADALTKVVHADPLRALPVLASFGARALRIEEDAATGTAQLFESSPALAGWRRM